MASTNKTTNYELSQYIGTDKPTYLGDYNSDMSKIDTAIHNNATAVSGVTGDITVLSGNIGTMANLETTDKSSLVNAVNEVNTKSNANTTNVGSLSNLETDNKTTIVNAINEIVEKFNITNFDDILQNEISVTNGSIGAYGGITVASNTDGSIAKIYGNITVSVNGNSSNAVVSFPSDLRPTTQITLKGGIIAFPDDNVNALNSTSEMVIKTNGTIEFKIWKPTSTGSAIRMKANLSPCLYFIKDFGDVPQQQ